MRFQSKLFFLVLFYSFFSLAQSLPLVDYTLANEKTFNINSDSSSKISSSPVDGKFLIWNKNYVGFKNEIDARPYDALVILFSNPQAQSINLNLEIKDSESKDYWSRVNYYVSVPPGPSEIHIPLSLRVGDTSRPGRALNLAKLTSIILARVDNKENANPLLIKKILLQKEINIVPKGIYAFDFGSEQSPVFPGFVGVNAKSLYSKQNAFGLVDAQIWQPYPLANDSLQPDSLYRDALFIPNGTFQVDLPNGDYEVVLNLDFSSGYWGEVPLFKKRNVFANEREVLHLSLDRNQAADRYFLFSEIVDHESEDYFKKYYSAIFKEHRFMVNIKDGSLRLRFEGDNCAENACFGMAVNSLIIVPKTLHVVGEKFQIDLLEARKKEFGQKFSFLPSALEKPKNLMLAKELIYFAWPVNQELPEKILSTEQLDKSLNLTLVRGQKGSLSIGLLSPEDIQVDIKIPALKKNQPTVKAWPVARRITRVEPASHIFTLAERYLLEKKSLELTKNENSRLWIEIDTSNTPAGQYQAELILNVKKKKLTIPIQIKVLNFNLPLVDFPVGPFNSTIQEAWWFENEYREKILQQKSFEAMQAAGLTTASFFTRFDVNWETNPLLIRNLDTITQMMKQAKAHGFLALIAYNSVFAYQDLCRGQFSDADLKRWVQALDQESKKQAWLPLNIMVCDEPVGDELPQALKRTQTLQNFNTERIKFGTAFSYDQDHSEFKKLYEQSYLPFLGLFSVDQLKKDQKKWIFYNSANRASFGFGLFRLKETTQLQARVAWNWNQNAGNPYFPLDAREDDVNWCNSLRNGDLQCSVFFKRHILEGLNDYRLALLLKNTKAKNANLTKDSERLLNEIKNEAPVSTEIKPGNLADLYVREQAWRNQILALLEKISDETKVKPKIK